MKFIIIVALLVILATLAIGFVAMIRGGEYNSKKLFSSLRLRIILTVLMLLFLIIAYYSGWIEPNRVLLDKVQ